ncbi:hypothetical protein [Yeosuana marina]|uniref:hypothetical protein n=1 Tax=Yeosuana marina TaxID=1565536 RepID=UPI0030C88706
MFKGKKIASFLNYQTTIFGFIILSFLFDFIDKVEIFYKIDFIKFNRYLKIVFVSYSFIFILCHKQYVLKTIKYAIYTFLIISVVFLLKFNYSNLYVNEYLRYAFVFVTFPLIYYPYFIKDSEFFYRVYIILKSFIILNVIVIALGFIFEIKGFQSYSSGRFGFNGFILSQGVTPYIYLSATIIFWLMKDKKMMVLIVLISVLSGIKGVYFAEFVLFCLLILCSKKLKKQSKALILGLIFIGFSFFTLVLLNQTIFKNLIDSKGWLSAIFSLRTEYTIELLNKITTENFNVLIGVIKLDKVRLELQVVDIFLFLGILGMATYIFFMYSFYNDIIKRTYSIVFFITTICLSGLIGNLFYIPMASILFFLTLFTLESNITTIVTK